MKALIDVSDEELAERTAKGHDLFDEMWNGVLHLNPPPSTDHQGFGGRLLAVCLPVEGPAELVVELLSPNDDSYKKLGFYAEMGVGEFLVIDPTSRQFERFLNRDGQFVLVQPAEGAHLASLNATITTVGNRLRIEAEGVVADI